MAVDRISGTVYLDVCNLGLWKSTNHGQSFQRFAQGKISGRCEFGYAINCDPAGSRMACLLLDGKCGMTLDGGKKLAAVCGRGPQLGVWRGGLVGPAGEG